MSHKKVKSHFKKVDPVIYAVMEGIDFKDRIKPRKKDDFFVSLCREITGQQLSGKVARVIFKRFINLFPRGKVTPQKVVKVSGQTLREVGMSWAKVKYVKDLAEKTESNKLNFKNLHRLADAQVITELTQVKGIGPWTAEMFLMFTLGREDVFSHGDLGLRKAVVKLYGLRKPTPERINRIVKPWSPYKSYGSIALWHSLE